MLFIGNQKATLYLQRSLEHGQFNHAYIFSGPEHVGKFTLAKMFALGAIGGDKFDLEIDNFKKEALFDLIVVEPEIVEKKGVSKKRDIPIESIRDAKKKLSLFPYHGKYKIMIIDEAQKLSISAQNALLKILEEPNPTTIIFLITHEIDKILSTVKSRCQILNFNLSDDMEMQKTFSEEIVSLAAGRPGLAKIMNENEEERNFRSEAIDSLNGVISGSLNEKFALAEEFSKDIVRTSEKLNVWLWEMRKKALSGVLPSSVLRTSSPFKGEENMEEIFDKMEKIQKSLEILKSTNANGRLVLETLFMEL